MEEPPSKMTKFEMESQYLEGEVMEEGQEEWLSEGILTDDDYNPGSQNTEADQSDSAINSQDETMASISAGDQSQEIPDSQQKSQKVDSNIEEALNNFEKSENNNQHEELPDDLNTFLIRKTDGKVVEAKKESDIEGSTKQSDDDGNDTDDLLRVLGDGDQKKKEQKKGKEKKEEDSSDDDDGFVFEGSKTKTYKVAKNALLRAAPKRAEPEDDDITDCSSDEAETMKQMFGVQNTTAQTTTTNTTSNSSSTILARLLTDKKEPSQEAKVVKKKVIQITHRTKAAPPPKVQTTPVKQYINKRGQSASLLKNNTSNNNNSNNSNKSNSNSKNNNKDVVKKTPEEIIDEQEFLEDDDIDLDEKTPGEIIDEQEFLEDDDIDLDEEFAARETSAPTKQRLMRPEEMDEEVLTDPESDSEDESLYDELPSSDSENVDDWFSLDIRAERAGDYIPLLGDNAYQLLSEEKQRVQARLADLQQNMAALTGSARQQAEQLREATTAVAELDTMLRAA